MSTQEPDIRGFKIEISNADGKVIVEVTQDRVLGLVNETILSALIGASEKYLQAVQKRFEPKMETK